MRTDVKVGLIIAAVLVAIGVGYLCFAGKSGDNGDKVANQPVKPPVPITHTPTGDASGDELAAAGRTDLDNPYSLRSADTTTRPTTRPTSGPAATGITGLSALTALDGSPGSSLGPLAGTTTTDPVTGKKYYTVKAGDMGLAAISKIVYGDQKYYPDIQKANVGVDTSRLRPGMKLLIPDRQAPAAAPVLTGAAARTGAGTATVIPAAGGGTPRVASGSRAPATPAVATDTPAVHLRTGAPARTVLPGGAVFD